MGRLEETIDKQKKDPKKIIYKMLAHYIFVFLGFLHFGYVCCITLYYLSFPDRFEDNTWLCLQVLLLGQVDRL